MKLQTILFAWLSLVLAANASADGGAVVGVVRGPGGVGLPGATVTLSAEREDRTTTVVTGEHGNFRIDDLEIGSYSIEGELHGFHSASATLVTVSSSGVTRVELSLSTATFHDTMLVETHSPHDSMEASELRESAARDLGEALALKPGVWKVRKGGIANDVVLRGFRQDDVTVLIDGARVAGACPNRMDPPVFHLDFSEVDRIEIDPSSGRMAAQGSLGGLVNVVTKKPGEGLNAILSLAAGSWNMLNPSATISWGGDRFAVLGGFSHRSSGVFEDGSGAVFTDEANYNSSAQGADAYDINSAWTRLYFQPASGHELHLSYARQEASDVLYPTLMMDAPIDDTDRLVAGYRFDSDGGILRSLRATAYVTQVEHWMIDSLRMTSEGAPRGWSMGTSATTEMIGGTIEAELGTVIVGLEAYTRNWNAWTEMAGMGYLRQYSIPDVELDALGLSARWSHGFSDRTRMELGARIDHVSTAADESIANTGLYWAYHGITDTSRSDTEPSFSFQISHEVGSSLTLSGSLSRTSRSPDARERYFGLKKKGSDWVGNPELAPPVATGAELGMGWSTGAGMLSASAWTERVGGYVLIYSQPRINVVPGVMNTQAMTYTNVDAHLRGASLAGSLAVSSRISISGSASYVRGTLDPIEELGIFSTDLPEMPPLSARLAVRWQNTRYFVEIEGLGAGSQEKVDEDLNESPTPSWGVMNLKAGLTQGHWRVQAVLANVFDRTYHEHFSYLRNPYRSGYVLNEPGRNLSLTLGWTF
jgi:iron complex outermembrane receptor protein